MQFTPVTTRGYWKRSQSSEALSLLRCSCRAQTLSPCRRSSTCIVPTSGVVVISLHAFVGRETNPNLGFRCDRSSERRFELSKATFADSQDWRNALEQPQFLF